MKSIGSLFQDFFRLLFHPISFYRKWCEKILSSSGLLYYFLIGLFFRTYASVLHYLWLRYLGEFISGIWKEFIRIGLSVVFENPEPWLMGYGQLQTRVLEFIVSNAPLFLVLFFNSFKIFSFGLLIHWGVRFFVLETEGFPITWKSSLKIFCLAQIPWFFSVIPGFGSVLAVILVFFATTAGVMGVYKASLQQAISAVFFPIIFMAVLLAFILFFVLFFAFNLFHLLIF